MKLKIIISIFLIVAAGKLAAQPELDIKPNRLEFEDLFNRFDFVYLINKGNQILTIDSITYRDSIYIIDYEGNLELPLSIFPGDSVRMNVLLSAFYQVTVNDTSDTMFVFNNGINNPEPLEVSIKFFEDEFGDFNGTVQDSLSPVDSSTVYFFYNGIYLLDTAMTNSSGFYQKTLPEGDYTIGVEKEGYYVVFHDSTYDPFFAEIVRLDSGDIKTIDFNLKIIDNTGLSVSGQINDSTSGSLINKGVIIVRTGTHVPIPKPKENPIPIDTINTFAGFIKSDGSYTVYTQLPDYYYLQAYSNNFLPGFFNDEGNASVFWQNADSILIDQNIIDKDISLLRDSSYGNGSIGGFITYSTPADESNFEGITIIAKNMNNGAMYSYNFGKQLGDYKVTNIPYGTYELIAQKIGLDNAISQTITIDPLNNQITGINLNFILSDVENEIIIPNKIILYQNYPNPFNPATNISFNLPEASKIRLKVINILGETVITLIDDILSSGTHTILFNGDNLATGVYLIILENNQLTLSRKIILLK